MKQALITLALKVGVTLAVLSALSACAIQPCMSEQECAYRRQIFQERLERSNRMGQQNYQEQMRAIYANRPRTVNCQSQPTYGGGFRTECN